MQDEIIELSWVSSESEGVFFHNLWNDIIAKAERLTGKEFSQVQLREGISSDSDSFRMIAQVIKKQAAFYRLLKHKKPGIERYLLMNNKKGYPICWDFYSFESIESFVMSPNPLDLQIYYKKPVTLHLIELLQEITNKTYAKQFSLYLAP